MPSSEKKKKKKKKDGDASEPATPSSEKKKKKKKKEKEDSESAPSSEKKKKKDKEVGDEPGGRLGLATRSFHFPWALALPLVSLTTSFPSSAFPPPQA